MFNVVDISQDIRNLQVRRRLEHIDVISDALCHAVHMVRMAYLGLMPCPGHWNLLFDFSEMHMVNLVRM